MIFMRKKKRLIKSEEGLRVRERAMGVLDATTIPQGYLSLFSLAKLVQYCIEVSVFVRFCVAWLFLLDLLLLGFDFLFVTTSTLLGYRYPPC